MTDRYIVAPSGRPEFTINKHVSDIAKANFRDILEVFSAVIFWIVTLVITPIEYFIPFLKWSTSYLCRSYSITGRPLVI